MTKLHVNILISKHYLDIINDRETFLEDFSLRLKSINLFSLDIKAFYSNLKQQWFYKKSTPPPLKKKLKIKIIKITMHHNGCTFCTVQNNVILKIRKNNWEVMHYDDALIGKWELLFFIYVHSSMSWILQQFVQWRAWQAW